MSTVLRNVGLVALFLLVQACRGDAERSNTDSPADDQSPVPLIDLDPTAVPLQFLGVVAEIGSADGDGLTFGNLTDVVVAPTGEIIVLDGTSNAAFVLSTRGDLLRVIGRRGQGPGEFRYPVDMRYGEDGLQIIDPVLSRVSWFNLNGELERTALLPPQGQFGQPVEMAIGSDGQVFNLGFSSYQESLEAGIGNRRRGAVRGENSLQIWTEASPEWKTLATFPGLEVFVDREAQRILNLPFPQKALWAPAPDGGFWHADNSEYSIGRFSKEGNELFRLRAPVSPLPVSAAEERNFYTARGIANADADRLRAIRRDRAALPMPGEKPVLDELVSDGGQLWIRLTSADGASTEWNVVSSDGRLVARYEIPARVNVKTLRGDTVFGVSIDDLGVNRVAILKVGT